MRCVLGSSVGLGARARLWRWLGLVLLLLSTAADHYCHIVVMLALQTYAVVNAPLL